jgi:hypothetical protein
MTTEKEPLDVDAIREALEARAGAIDELQRMPPSQQLMTQITAMIEEGDRTAATLRSLHREIKMESRRLSQIRDGFVRNLCSTLPPRVDFRG